MRRKDRELSFEEAEEILFSAEYGVLSTVSSDGVPYGVPMSFAYRDGVIYMHCANAGGHRLGNLKENPNACFTVVGDTRLLPERFGTLYRSAIAFGTVREAVDEEQKRIGLTALLKKYSSGFMEQGMKYMEAALSKVTVLELEVEVKALSGKGRKG